MIAARWNLRSTLQETPSLNFVIQSALDNAKLLNWNFRLLESDMCWSRQWSQLLPAYASLFRGSQPLFFLRTALCEQPVWWTLQASILGISLNYRGNPCRTLYLGTKVEMLNDIKKGDVLRTNNNAVIVLFVQLEVWLIRSILQFPWTSY